VLVLAVFVTQEVIIFLGMSSTQPLCCLPYKQAKQSLADTILCGAIILLHSSAEEHYYLLSLPILVRGVHAGFTAGHLGLS
jgi:hypothetical protein